MKEQGGLYMNRKEANLFIEEMKDIGDDWTIDQVMDVYGDTSLDDALSDRKSSINIYTDIIDKVVNR